ncbi:MAG: C4-dicarboxylate TRAP transporter substrate-binding protein [Sneathiella sp.]
MTLKKLISTLSAVAAVAATFTGQAALAEDINVTIAAGHPPVFRWVKHTSKTFIPAVNKALEGSGYKIIWQEQYAGSLAKVGSVLEAVEEGLAEIGVVSTVFEPAKLSVQNVTYYTPFASSDAKLVANTLDQLHSSNTDFTQTWRENNLEYLGGGIAIDDYLLMTNFPVNKISDLKGRKIAAPGPAVNWLKGSGATGVAGNLTTYYNEIKTGVYDGVIVFASAAVPSKLYEVAPTITRIGFGAQYAGGISANSDWFNDQPKVVQDALRKAGDTMRIAYLEDLQATVVKFTEIMKSQGATVSDVDEAFRQEWAQGMDNDAKTWAASLDKAGKNGTAVLKNYMDALRAAGAKPVRNWDQE